MKKILNIGYIILFLFLILMLYLEYDNYKNLNFKIDARNYSNEIEKLKNNLNIISNYDIDNHELTVTINRCQNSIKYKDILNKDFITIADIYYINQNSASGVCNGMNYGIENSYEKKNVDLNQYINIYNDKNIEESLKITLNNEINITSAFIEMVEYLKGDYDV